MGFEGSLRAPRFEVVGPEKRCEEHHRPWSGPKAHLGLHFEAHLGLRQKPHFYSLKSSFSGSLGPSFSAFRFGAFMVQGCRVLSLGFMDSALGFRV